MSRVKDYPVPWRGQDQDRQEDLSPKSPANHPSWHVDADLLTMPTPRPVAPPVRLRLAE